MMLLKWLIGILAVFGGFVALMYFKQRTLLYFPERMRTPPAAAGFAQAEEITLDTPDGERVIVWFVPPQDGHPVVLYLQGNAAGLANRVDRFRAITGAGNGLVALSYRGYAGSTGSPSEQGLITDAETAYAFVAARFPAERIVIWGESLGTGVAVALAAERPVTRVVLQSPFSSTADVGAGRYWYLPVRLLMKDQFRSDLRIGKIHAPLLILHGERDQTVPIEFSERLFALANEPKRMVRFPDGSHNDLDTFGALKVALPFVAEAR